MIIGEGIRGQKQEYLNRELSFEAKAIYSRTHEGKLERERKKYQKHQFLHNPKRILSMPQTVSAPLTTKHAMDSYKTRFHFLTEQMFCKWMEKKYYQM